MVTQPPPVGIKIRRNFSKTSSEIPPPFFQEFKMVSILMNEFYSVECRKNPTAAFQRNNLDALSPFLPLFIISRLIYGKTLTSHWHSGRLAIEINILPQPLTITPFIGGDIMGGGTNKDNLYMPHSGDEICLNGAFLF